MAWEGGKDTVLQDAGVPWLCSDGVTVCPQPHSHGDHLTAGAKAPWGPQPLGPSMLGEGTGDRTVPFAPQPNP